MCRHVVAGATVAAAMRLGPDAECGGKGWICLERGEVFVVVFKLGMGCLVSMEGLIECRLVLKLRVRKNEMREGGGVEKHRFGWLA